MLKEVIGKKLEQMGVLLQELSGWLSVPWLEFGRDQVKLRAAERNFQLIVDLAADINTQLLLEAGKPTPETYRHSFLEAGRAGLIPSDLADKLAASAGLRNILVHEYDLEGDPQRFYNTAKGFVGLYQDYCRLIQGKI